MYSRWAVSSWCRKNRKSLGVTTSTFLYCSYLTSMLSLTLYRVSLWLRLQSASAKAPELYSSMYSSSDTGRTYSKRYWLSRLL